MSSSETDRLHKEAIEDARKFILKNFSRQITVTEIAASVYMSTYHFCRIFKKHTSYAPYQCLLAARLEHAAFLLAHSDKTITRICCLSGFKRIGHFSAMFAKKYRISPSAFRWQALADACRQDLEPATGSRDNATINVQLPSAR